MHISNQLILSVDACESAVGGCGSMTGMVELVGTITKEIDKLGYVM